MAQIIEHLIRAILEAFGIGIAQQFALMLIVLLAIFIVYLVRERHSDWLLSTILITMTLAFVVFLFTESEQTRRSAAAVVCGTMVGAFVRYALRSRGKSA